MWRTRAVERMLAEDIAGLPRPDGAGDDDTARGDLEIALRRAWRAVIVDWVAVAALLTLRFGEAPLVNLGPGVDAVFAIGVLLIATHAGFRLGQLEKLRCVERLLQELEQRARD